MFYFSIFVTLVRLGEQRFQRKLIFLIYELMSEIYLNLISDFMKRIQHTLNNKDKCILNKRTKPTMNEYFIFLILLYFQIGFLQSNFSYRESDIPHSCWKWNMIFYFDNWKCSSFVLNEISIWEA